MQRRKEEKNAQSIVYGRGRMKIKNKLGNFIRVPGAVSNHTYRGWGYPFNLKLHDAPTVYGFILETCLNHSTRF